MPDHSTASAPSAPPPDQPAPPVLQRDIKPLILPALWLLYVASNFLGVLLNGTHIFKIIFGSQDSGQAAGIYGYSKGDNVGKAMRPLPRPIRS